jgi:hypothetical protein
LRIALGKFQEFSRYLAIVPPASFTACRKASLLTFTLMVISSDAPLSLVPPPPPAPPAPPAPPEPPPVCPDPPLSLYLSILFSPFFKSENQERIQKITPLISQSLKSYNGSNQRYYLGEAAAADRLIVFDIYATFTVFGNTESAFGSSFLFSAYNLNSSFEAFLSPLSRARGRVQRSYWGRQA